MATTQPDHFVPNIDRFRVTTYYAAQRKRRYITGAAVPVLDCPAFDRTAISN
jgi:hypothetical protein